MNPIVERLVNEKVDAAFKNANIPKKFFITENGRGVVDGGDLYNAAVADMVSIMKVAIGEILSEIVSTQPAQKPAPQPQPAPQPAPQPVPKQQSAQKSKVGTKK